MLKNYILVAWKVLLRRKAFTFISLFGITITLTVLMVLSTFLDNYLHPHGPEKTNSNYLSVNKLFFTSKDGNNRHSSRLGYKFIKDNVLRLKTPEKISVYSSTINAAGFINGDKITNHMRRTDAEYWNILSFDFLEGRPFNQREFEQGILVTVISKTTRKELFGDQSALDMKITVNNQTFSVVGVVDDVSFYERSAVADLWVPYTTAPSSEYTKGLMGGWEVLLYHSNQKMLKEIQSEYINLLKEDLITSDPENYYKAISTADTPFERIARGFTNSRTFDTGAPKVISMFLLLVFAFMLLPSVNLINLNISRILERTSEIGVRKAFGASSRQLVIQFIVENILISFIGGLLAFVISLLILQQAESVEFIQGSSFYLSTNTFIYGLSMVLVFGVLSGAYPAFKMSNLHPVAALKGGA